VSRLERIVLGRGIFGTPSAPTVCGLFDPEFAVEQLVDAVVAFEGVVEHPEFWVVGEGDEKGANA
jgi:hypothetical protein